MAVQGQGGRREERAETESTYLVLPGGDSVAGLSSPDQVEHFLQE